MKISKIIFSSKHITAKLLIIAILSSTFYQFLPDKIDTIIIFLPQLILSIYALVIMYRYIKRVYIPSKFSKVILNLTLILTVYYAFLVFYRYFTNGNITQSIYHIITIFSAIILFFIIDVGIQKPKDAYFDLFLSITLINILQIIVSIYINSIRFSFVLQNIMIYISCTCLMVPFLFYTLSTTSKSYIKYISILNLIIIFVANFASGSRIGLVVVIFSYIISMAINIGENKKFLYHCGITMLTSILIILSFYNFNYMDIKTSILRQTIAYIDINQNTDINNQITASVELIENSSKNSSVIEEDHKQYVLDGINSSNSVRADLWKRSFEEIMKKPIFGTGIISFDVNYLGQTVMQGAHNFILESILIFGSLGGIMYLILLAFPPLLIIIIALKYRIKLKLLLNFVVSLGTLFSVALVQPILTAALPIMLYWILSGIVAYNIIIGSTNVDM